MPFTATAYGHDSGTVNAEGDWRARARCLGCDPEIMFPFPNDLAGNAAAKAVCRPCPVRTECLVFAKRAGCTFGVWGGLSETERHPRAASALAVFPDQDPVPVPMCRRGLHEMTGTNLQSNGSSHQCRECARRRKADAKANKKALVNA